LLKVGREVLSYLRGPGNLMFLLVMVDRLKQYADFFGDMSAALQPLHTAISMVQGLLNMTESPVKAIGMSLESLFNNILLVVGEATRIVTERRGEFDAAIAAMGDPEEEGSVAYLLTQWAEGLAPLSAVLDVGRSIMETMGDKIKKMNIPITGFLTKLLNMTDLVKRWIESYEASYGGEGFAGQMEALKNLIAPGMTSLRDALEPINDLLQMFADMGKATETEPGEAGIGDAAVAAIQAVAAVLNQVKGALTGVNLQGVYDAAYGLGAQLGQGLVDGMYSMLARVQEVAAELAQAAADAIATAGEISSPSQVMVRLGEQMAAGFAIGMGDGAGPRGYQPAMAVAASGTVLNLNINIAQLYGTDKETAEIFGGEIARQIRQQGARV
ncbi:MAG TPA: hypothetical protein VNA25_13185, partial [Phycisphaerae bacterium]|nr:hypothetical protein [Phycisphaerae bacterium]